MLDYPEVVVRLTLWCIVVGLYPTLLMTLIGVLWFPSRAITQMHQALNDRLDDAISHLTDSLAPLPETRIEREALALQKLNVFCLADDANWRTQSAWWQSCVATVTYIYSTLNRYDPPLLLILRQLLNFGKKLATEINKLQHAIAEGQCWQSDWRISESEAMAARECNLENICQTLLQLGQMDPNTPPTPATKPPSMAADAFTNPDYMRYAVKNTARLFDLLHLLQRRGLGRHSHLYADLRDRPLIRMLVRRTRRWCCVLAGPFAARFWHCYSRYWSCPGWTILSNCCLCWHRFSCWAHGLPPALNALLISAHRWWLPSRSPRSKMFLARCTTWWKFANRALGIIIGTVVSAVIYTFVWPESEARTLPQKLAGALGMLSKVMRIPRQQEVTALRTYLQIRIGLHAAFNACEEMCQRVALERQLDSEERALLIERSQTVIRQGRDILHAWDATWNSAQALDNALQPDRAGQFADALEKYAAGLATALSRSPQITLEETPASQAILPTLLKQEQHVCQLFARLPDWTAPALTPATEQVQGATQ
ncbi:multidrug resistance protein [Escherichia coli]|uniref:Multidrug resistance protein n=1 Tax=Escherichia coli TaxID=562 RepID=A0A485JLV0_ECOLX|nr:multidrug resistance protein [Escherichia coli]